MGETICFAGFAALATLLVLGAGLALAACMLSSMISRREERHGRG